MAASSAIAVRLTVVYSSHSRGGSMPGCTSRFAHGSIVSVVTIRATASVSPTPGRSGVIPDVVRKVSWAAASLRTEGTSSGTSASAAPLQVTSARNARGPPGRRQVGRASPCARGAGFGALEPIEHEPDPPAAVVGYRRRVEHGGAPVALDGSATAVLDPLDDPARAGSRIAELVGGGPDRVGATVGERVAVR